MHEVLIITAVVLIFIFIIIGAVISMKNDQYTEKQYRSDLEFIKDEDEFLENEIFIKTGLAKLEAANLNAENQAQLDIIKENEEMMRPWRRMAKMRYMQARSRIRAYERKMANERT